MTIIARSLSRRLLTPLATIRSASMSRPESVSSRMASWGSSTAIWKISLRFFSPPENPSLTERPVKLWSIAPGEDLRQRALARAVGAHYGVHLARPDLEVDAAQDLLACVAYLGVQVLDAEHGFHPAHPMLPSRLTLRSFCASTANSIGSSLKTSRQKPLTIIDTASSCEMPRCVQ